MTKSPPRALRERDAARYLDELPERAPPDEVAERRLIELAKAGDDRAKERLVEAFLPRIAAIARHYRVGGAVNRVELVQEGVVGLLRALERYRPAGGNPFWGYASWWVRQATQQLVAELTRPIVLSDRALRQLSRLRDAHAALLREGEVEPSLRALAGRAGLGDEEVESLLAADWAARSLEEPLGDEEGAVGPFGELIEDPVAEDEYERALDRIEGARLRAILASLSSRERYVLKARHGEGSRMTLTAVGGKLGLSSERVRQIEQRALAKLAAGRA